MWICGYVHICRKDITCLHTCTCTPTQICGNSTMHSTRPHTHISMSTFILYTHAHAHTHAHTHVYTHTHTHTHTHSDNHTYACMHILCVHTHHLKTAKKTVITLMNNFYSFKLH